eukprot:TRINITY_DN14611_c0_g1_i1.p1 TRINITY_DN14611_c0_g1~~TRINITY_DN14611_c0_g1_i1.p1  ORF type:complete len:419 (-),score=50.03 TRINITY_DN14611_c0_g1_i1:234-1490(-)
MDAAVSGLVMQSRDAFSGLLPRAMGDVGEGAMKPMKKPSLFLQVASGVAASLIAELALYPIDTVKIRVQSSISGFGFLATAKELFRLGGVGRFFNGVGTSLFKETVHSSNYWLWHTLLFRYFSDAGDTSRTPAHRRLVLNLIAKQLNWLCTTPFEIISSVNQLTDGSPGALEVTKRLWEQGGLSSFYRGLTISLVLAVNPAIMNTLITSLQRLVVSVKLRMGMDHFEARDHGTVVVGTATAVAKTLATAITYPLIRVKVIMQTGTLGSRISAFGVLRQVVADEGWLGLYRGVLAMSYKTVAWNSIMMIFKHLLSPRNEVTPPSSPCLRASSFPLMGREPFPIELLTADKLDEILQTLRLQNVDVNGKRIGRLEERLETVSDEIREIKHMLMTVDSAAAGSNDRGPSSAMMQKSVHFST